MRTKYTGSGEYIAEEQEIGGTTIGEYIRVAWGAIAETSIGHFVQPEVSRRFSPDIFNGIPQV